MRIPLDYYRILSVPIQASAEQLEQAYSDRLLQKPRREYNEQAILARQELIQQAYQILTHSEQRAAYDAQFLVNLQPLETLEIAEQVETADPAVADNPKPSEPSTVNPSIEIPASQLVGALLILHELGEYELLLKLGIESLNSREFNEHLRRQEKAIKIATRKNMILSMALAYLELGREQWHRREYENAALADQMGLDLLIKENLFSQVQEELELDLYKLRPYRVLELISQNPADSPERVRAFKLLREMLQQRQGIEGKGEDRSGLSFDQFLCFIQQLRTYLTSAEQQQLFEAEAQSNSAIANYLAVYALLGRGFSLKQPELILRAQRMLNLLSERQDVAWEQSVCALLLGHTDKAIRKLQDIQDPTKLELFKQNYLNNNDLLPSLCFYSEQWLQEDVVAQFPDLSASIITLKEYFADREVQAYLEELIPATPAVVSDKRQAPISKSKQSATNATGIFSRWRNLFSTEKVFSAKANTSEHAAQPERELVGVGVGGNSQKTTTAKRSYNDNNFSRQTKPKSRQALTQNRSTQKRSSPNLPPQSPSLPLQPRATRRAVPSSVIQQYQSQKVKQRQISRRRKKRSKATLVKGWLFIIGLVLGVGTTGFMAMRLFLNPEPRTANKAQLAIAIGQPAVELSSVSVKPVPTKPKLTFDQQSQQVIQQWLTSKSAAFGKEYQIEKLNNILAEPLLGTWRNRAVAYKQGDFYREYEHKLKMRSATISQNDPNQATVEAEVQEVAKHYQSGQLDQTQSYNDNLLVRYQLVRQGEKWLIQDSEVLKTL
ncbi:IMS domain-containing protein [Pleurocapsa sp. PCC 7319]|uniref:IMS domain-containing protein n=1 Tax=Pleurocapsa sp. PCC 7319 TaxID=118161 RepID=UPI00034B516C|nr:IMS domain-containing protein [Pleurocapsa sp. PCC 7319]